MILRNTSRASSWPTTLPVLGWIKSYAAPVSRAAMNASVTATEMLKFVTCVRSSLQLMNSRTSGWSTRRMPMLAPRRVPPCFTTSVEASYSFMNDTGPEATPIVDRTTSFLGRRRENEKPVPLPDPDERGPAPGPARGEQSGAGRNSPLERPHEARRELAQGPARVHQGRGVRHPHPRRHEIEERFREPLDRTVGRAVRPIGRGDVAGYAPEQVLRAFGRLPVVVLHQVAALQDREGVGVQIELGAVGGISHAGSSLCGESVSLLNGAMVEVNGARKVKVGAAPRRSKSEREAPRVKTIDNSHHKLGLSSGKA